MIFNLDESHDEHFVVDAQQLWHVSRRGCHQCERHHSVVINYQQHEFASNDGLLEVKDKSYIASIEK